MTPEGSEAPVDLTADCGTPSVAARPIPAAKAASGMPGFIDCPFRRGVRHSHAKAGTSVPDQRAHPVTHLRRDFCADSPSCCVAATAVRIGPEWGMWLAMIVDVEGRTAGGKTTWVAAHHPGTGRPRGPPPRRPRSRALLARTASAWLSARALGTLRTGHCLPPASGCGTSTFVDTRVHEHRCAAIARRRTVMAHRCLESHRHTDVDVPPPIGLRSCKRTAVAGGVATPAHAATFVSSP